MSSVRDMKVAEILFKICPKLAHSEESVQQLVMRDIIDFNTGMELTQNIKSLKSLEDETIPANINTDLPVVKKDEVVDVPEGGITFPSIDENVVAKVVMELSPADEKESFNALIDQLNTQFQAAYKKRRDEIIRVVSQVVEISEADTETAKKIMDIIKQEQIVLIKK